MTVESVNVNVKNFVETNSQKKVKLKEACDEFVSILYQQMFEAMESSMKVDDTIFDNSDKQTDFAKYMFNKNMSKEVIKQDNNNLAQLLYEQMLEKSGLK